MANTIAIVDRRSFLRSAAAGTGLALLGSAVWTQPAQAQQRLFGNLMRPDANGVRLPEGFTSRIIATTGQIVGDTGYEWHPNPDGGAVFAQPDGGWIYVSNDEASDEQGGASMVRFDADANIIDARSILSGTSRNCAGGATPWGTWLSCEEFGRGRVWECDPTGENPAVVREAMGIFLHEAAACDDNRQQIYMTEDHREGLLYRFTPNTWGDLSEGVLEGMVETGGGGVGWAVIDDPSARNRTTRRMVDNPMIFAGGEGAWFDDPYLYFTTKRDTRVWRYNAESNELEVIYDIETAPNPVLDGVDNVVVSANGDLYVCEDGGNMEVVVLGANGAVHPFLRLTGFNGSEVTGAAFDPSGTRMYVSSQRNPGVTFEITGPFLGDQAQAPPPAAREPEANETEANEPEANEPEANEPSGGHVGSAGKFQ